MKLTQGVMAAVSAGMLIYAASVEMLAGDFIMDPSLWKSGVGRQALALISLLVGASAMAAIGWVSLTSPPPFCSDGDSIQVMGIGRLRLSTLFGGYYLEHSATAGSVFFRFTFIDAVLASSLLSYSIRG